MSDTDTPDRKPELVDYVLALETAVLGLKPSETYEIRVDLLRALLASWHELRDIGCLSESLHVDVAEEAMSERLVAAQVPVAEV